MPMPDLPSLMTRYPVDVVAIGASAGGLDAFRQLLEALPVPNGMAFILVQHLTAERESHLVDLLTPCTALLVMEAVDGTPVLADHLYVITPGTFVALRAGVLRVTPASEHPGQRLPLDFLMHALAAGYGPRAMAIVLSGSGLDGSKGALAIRSKGGLVLVQDPAEAEFMDMPQGVIAAGAASAVLPLAGIPAALLEHGAARAIGDTDQLPRIITLLKNRASVDFALYKPGTLRRRIERRMGLASIKDMGAYRERLETDTAELALLGTDMLIHVTAFFRDPAIFALLETQILPALVADHPADLPLRVWVAGCSTGEETWSLAILFKEAISASGRAIKLQVFGSDLDAAAVSRARRARYPDLITGAVSPERLARFFVQDSGGWLVCQELRSCVVFTVQDVLADAPFSRLDFISCRNLLIYLKPAAQARVVSLFHFALRPGGFLLLGNAEALGPGDHGFESVAKPERLWRRGAERRRLDVTLLTLPGEAGSVAPRGSRVDTNEARLAELCRRLLFETHVPAAVLLDRNNSSLYSLGPTEAYLAHATGQATQNIMLLARPAIRAGLRVVLRRTREAGEQTSVTITGTAGNRLRLDARPIPSEPGEMLLLCFVELPGTGAGVPPGEGADPRIILLEQELEGARTELRHALQSLERSGEEQRTIDEEALSVNEEYQSTNEELLTSKEELQSLNEELTALNGQLQETLERTRTTSNDLQNVLYSTDVATLFLDGALRIRFFTPATLAVFNLLPGDIGRPLADLAALATDEDLQADVQAMLKGSAAPPREIRTAAGIWFMRSVLPYRTQERQVDGAVITYADITARKKGAQALLEARLAADAANAAKSQFLSAASHDLRQPLQTLILQQSLLARVVEGDEATRIVRSLEPTLGAMTGILNTLLDVDQVGSGTLVPTHSFFRIGLLLEKLRLEFSHLATARGLELRVVPSSAVISTDPTLLELMLRNLLDNALKYTPRGRILLGCRRRRGTLSIEVVDTGIGIAEQNLKMIFGAYRQVGQLPPERQAGLGLGLSLVQRLAVLMGHQLTVRSRPGHGSVFAVFAVMAEIAPDGVGADGIAAMRGGATPRIAPPAAPEVQNRQGTILLIEDDEQLRGLLVRLLIAEGHDAHGVADGHAALALVRDGRLRPQLLLADFNLPGGMNGLEAATLLRAQAGGWLPVVILTGDMALETQRMIMRLDYVQLHKPVRPEDLMALVRRMMEAPAPRPPDPTPDMLEAHVVHIVDDDAPLRTALRQMLEGAGYTVEEHESAETFLSDHPPGSNIHGCLLIDARLPGMCGYELLNTLRARGGGVPALMMTGYSDIPGAVRAIKAGAADFIQKPVEPRVLLAVIAEALAQTRDDGRQAATRKAAAEAIGRLTERQREIMDRVLAGEPSKNIAADLGISQRTVEAHRAAIMRATGARSLPALARLAVAAAERPEGEGGA